MKLKSDEHIQIELEFLFRQQLNLQTAITDEFGDTKEQNKLFQIYIDCSFRTIFCYIYQNNDESLPDIDQLDQNPLFVKTAILLEESFNLLNQTLFDHYKKSKDTHSQQRNILIQSHIKNTTSDLLALFKLFNNYPGTTSNEDKLYFE